jgi:hypothetical protein
MRYILLFMCIAIIIILEVVISNFFDAMKEMLANTNPIVGLVLLFIFVDIFAKAKDDLKGIKEVFKKLWNERN